MRKHQAVTALLDQTDAVKALGATSLYLFGSTAPDDAGPASDIHLFVDYDAFCRL
jgi:predicted nucleotidyltransferase